MELSEVQITSGLRYIKRWLGIEGYDASKWDGKSEDGHWLLHAMTSADGSRCTCCQEPILRNAPDQLVRLCGWTPLHIEVLDFVVQKAADQ